MARKSLESNSKRKAAVDLTGAEVVISLPANHTKIESNKKPKPSKTPQVSKKKVKFESPVKKDEVEVKKVKKIKAKRDVEAADEIENGSLYAFPMNRVTRIVKSDNSDIKLSADAAFLFNKASEKFLELFSKEAYSCASKDGKKKIEYQHLSSVIPGNTRFDFLSDFVPAKVKVADALKEIPSIET